MRTQGDLQFEEFASDITSAQSSEYVELPLSGRVFLLVGGAALLLALIVVGRIGFLNLGKADFYAARSLSNVNREVAIPANRGVIVDRYGEVIAKNAETFSVFVSASELIRDRKTLHEVLTKLAEVLQVSVSDLMQILEEEDFETKTSVAIARNISPEAAIAIRSLDLGTVLVQHDFRREYVNGAAFSHVVGYTGVAEQGSAVVGRTGLELAYDDVLRGKDGVYVYHRDARGKVLEEGVTEEAVPGLTLETTLDAALQAYFHDRLGSGLRGLGVRGGVGIALDPRTSEVLALVSFPDFDNNLFVTSGTSKERNALIQDPGRPLFNRAISGAYNPGSTIKTLVALAALKEKVISATREILSIGYIEIPNPYAPDKPSRFVDWKPQGYVDVRSALAKSSNVYFYVVGGGYEDIKGLGINKLKEYWQKFQFGKITGLDIGPEAKGLLPDPKEKEERTGTPWRLGDTYNVSIGQGDFLVSPLQLINFIASIGNNGHMYQPRIMRRIANEDGNFGAAPIPKTLFDYSSWEFELAEVRAGMEDAVEKEYGTAHLLSNLPFTIGAKTGTAQTNNNTKENAFFVGYAPADNPEIAILVLVENARQGSLNAVPIAKDVLEWYYENRIVSGKSNSENP